MQFEKLEIHKVFLCFPNFNLEQNLSPLSLTNFIIGYLEEIYEIKNDIIGKDISVQIRKGSAGEGQ